MTKKIEKVTSLRAEVDKVARIIRKEIYSGVKMPNERLVERSLAERFSVSRVIIRQVISQLEFERLVEVEPYKGAKVAPITIERILKMYETDSLLEGCAAKLAAENMTPGDIDKLNDIVEVQRRVPEGNAEDWQRLNLEFHKTINLKCGNETIIQLIRQNVQFTNYWFLFLSIPANIAKNLGEHTDIIRAFIEHDGEKARQLVEQHIMTSGRQLVGQIHKSLPVAMLGGA